jgi:hypothetical protein
VAFERLGSAGGLIIANGFYITATLTLTVCLRERAVRGVVAAGYAVFGFGTLLSLSGFTGVAWHAEAMTGPTIMSFCVWVLLVARSFRSSEQRG